MVHCMHVNIVMKLNLIIFSLNLRIKVNTFFERFSTCSVSDQVDRIILDKPHYYNEHQLDVMKYIPSNVELTNVRYSSKKLLVKDAIDDDNYNSVISGDRLSRNQSVTKEPISEIDLENEVYRLQEVFKKLNEDFACKRKQLEDDCCEQLKTLNQNDDKTHRSQQDLEQGITHSIQIVFNASFIF